MENTMRLSSPATFLPFGLALLAAPSLAAADVSAQKPADHHSETEWIEEVVGGSQVSPGQWPDAAGVFFTGELGCTGTLVAPNVVLTAGHCMDASIDTVLLDSTDAALGGEEIAVVQRIAYPNWETTYDVGLLILAKASTVPPRMIARGCALEQFYSQGAPVELVGYGATDVQGTQYGTRLLGGSASIIDADCTTGNGCNAQVSPGGELIAGGGGVDSCFGDSGGPVYLRTLDADYLIGVTSRGLDNSPTPCGGGGIYTRADAIAGWIEEQAGVTLPMADCQNDSGNPDPDPSDPGEPGEPGGSGEPDGPGGSGGDGSGTGSGTAVTGGCSSVGSHSTGLLGYIAIGFSALLLRRRREDI